MRKKRDCALLKDKIEAYFANDGRSSTSVFFFNFYFFVVVGTGVYNTAHVRVVYVRELASLFLYGLYLL